MLRTIIRRILKPNICYVFGDSHSYVFASINKNFPLFKLYFEIIAVPGATAQGMRNPNSKTQSLKIFLDRLVAVSDKNANLFFQLGEVDTGFVIWYRAEKYNETIENQLNDSLRAYKDFLLEVSALGFKNIHVISSPLPTIVDNQNWGEIADLRKEVKATQLERTKLTIEYNRGLKDICYNLDFMFIDTDPYLLDIGTGKIRNKFVNSDPFDHHLDSKEYSRVLVREIKKII